MSAAAATTTSSSAKPFQTKLVLLGEAAVGKSSVVLRFVSNEFAENKEPTIGAAFLTQKCRLEDKVIKFEIWDTAGQERFHSLAPMYYRNAQASAVIYDVTKASSFEKAKSWVKELQRQANPNIVIALVGNKIDLLTNESSNQEEEDEDKDDDESDAATTTAAEASSSSPSDANNTTTTSESLRAVPQEEAKAYADESGLLFFETSAKTGQGVLNVFTEIAKKINPQDIQRSNNTNTQSNTTGTAGRTGRNNNTAAGNGSIDLAEGERRRPQDACNC
ncbi:unnamed protein product [Sympodiomycopsis kandeliae]